MFFSMKKMIIALALVAGMMVPSVYANGDGDKEHDDGVNTRIVMVSSLNVRAGASVSSAIVGTLALGDKVDYEVKSADGLWCRVDVPSRGWNDVYVACRYLGFKTMSAPSGNGWIEINGTRTVGMLLNVRSAAAVGNNLISFLKTGDQVFVKAKSANGLWCKIDFNKFGRIDGYVACRYLMK